MTRRNTVRIRLCAFSSSLFSRPLSASLIIAQGGGVCVVWVWSKGFWSVPLFPVSKAGHHAFRQCLVMEVCQDGECRSTEWLMFVVGMDFHSQLENHAMHAFHISPKFEKKNPKLSSFTPQKCVPYNKLQWYTFFSSFFFSILQFVTDKGSQPILLHICRSQLEINTL